MFLYRVLYTFIYNFVHLYTNLWLRLCLFDIIYIFIYINIYFCIDETAAKVFFVSIMFCSLLAFEFSSHEVSTSVSCMLQQLTATEICYEVGKSIIQTLLIFPIISVVIAVAYLVFDAVLERFITKNHDFLNAPIYYSVLYLPFSSVYFITKKRLREKCKLLSSFPSWKRHREKQAKLR